MTMGELSSSGRPTKASFLNRYASTTSLSEEFQKLEGLDTFDSDWQKDSLLLMAEQVCAGLKARTDLPKETVAILCRLIEQFSSAAELYYTTGINKLSISDLPGLRPSFDSQGLLSEQQPLAAERRNIIRDISVEWTRLMGLVGSAQLLGADDPAMRMIRATFLVARNDLKIGNGGRSDADFVVLPHFGRHFELVSFNYEPSIFVLGVPVASIYCPWEWPLIWHEMAGLYVREHANASDGVIEKLAGLIKQHVSNPELWKQWVAEYGDDLELLPKQDDRLSDMVIQNWAQELTEDTAGLLCLGRVMFLSLDAALTSAYAQVEQPQEPRGDGLQPIPADLDLRHPPAQLRLDFAASLLRQRDLNGAEDGAAPAGIRGLAALAWNERDSIVAQPPFTSGDENQLEAVLQAMHDTTPLAAWTLIGVDPQQPKLDTSHIKQVRALIAGATLAFHTRLAREIRSARRSMGARAGQSA
jgi:hypothetical protein